MLIRKLIGIHFHCAKKMPQSFFPIPPVYLLRVSFRSHRLAKEWKN